VYFQHMHFQRSQVSSTTPILQQSSQPTHSSTRRPLPFPACVSNPFNRVEHAVERPGRSLQPTTFLDGRVGPTPLQPPSRHRSMYHLPHLMQTVDLVERLVCIIPWSSSTR